MATDITVWKYFPMIREDYYHGLGYWADAFLEVRPHKNLSLNGHLYAFNGTISHGYLEGGKVLQNIGASWKPFSNDKFIVRAVDLGRVTIGSGLVVEDREGSGLIVQ